MVAQWKLAGPITQSAEDQNLVLLLISFWYDLKYSTQSDKVDPFLVSNREFG